MLLLVQSNEVSSGKNGLNAPPFMARSEVLNGSGIAANGPPKPRARARRGQATDPHSIAERVLIHVSFLYCLNLISSLRT
jgi:hypothetical protein